MAPGKKGGSTKKSGGFEGMGLSRAIYKGIKQLGYNQPTPIQRRALPVALGGKDIVAMARTGSGKTAAFLVPLLERLQEHASRVGVRGVVLSPTRELAVQSLKFAKHMGKFTDLRCALLVGGESMDAQFDLLANNPDIIVATPGRLMHLLQEVPTFNLRQCEFLIFDEADRLFEMGFAEQLREIMKGMPETRQTLLFSATMPQALAQFARAGLRDPEIVRLDSDFALPDSLLLAFLLVRTEEKAAALLRVLQFLLDGLDQTIIFTPTRHHVDFVSEILRARNIEVCSVFGDMDQAARTIQLAKFRARKAQVLVTTDVGARGIDIPLLDNVLNYGFPPTAKLFVHRVGRAARQGRRGLAISLVAPDELPYMVDLHLFLGRRLSCPGGHYSLAAMTPEDVHYGSFPQLDLDVEAESLAEIIHRGPAGPLQRVCDNAYKQYVRSRPDPSHQSVKRSKELLRGVVHPLLSQPGAAEAAEPQAPTEAVPDPVGFQDLLTFRPKETVFEVTASARGAKRNERAADIMRAKRAEMARRMRVAQLGHHASSAPAAGAAAPTEAEAEAPTEAEADADAAPAPAPAPKVEKRRLSKAERSRAKKARTAGAVPEMAAEEERRQEKSKKTSFKDEENYIHYGAQKTATMAQLDVRHGESNLESYVGNRLEEALLDVMPDEAMEMHKRKKVWRWDKRHNKYVQSTMGDSMKGMTHVRNEAGNKTKRAEPGKIYERWARKTNKEVTRVGAEEGEAVSAAGKRAMKRQGGYGMDGTAEGARGAAARGSNDDFATDELKSAKSIATDKKKKNRLQGKAPDKKKKFKKRNLPGKSHGAPTRSKMIRRS